MKKRVIIISLIVALVVAIAVVVMSCQSNINNEDLTSLNSDIDNTQPSSQSLEEDEIKSSSNEESQVKDEDINSITESPTSETKDNTSKPDDTEKTTKEQNNSTSRDDDNASTNDDKKETATEKPTSKPVSSNNDKDTDEKEWHDAVYKTVHHEAEYKKVWVVDKEGYTYEKPIYESVYGRWSVATGENISHLSQDELDEYIKNLLLSGQSGQWYTDTKEIQVDTETIVVDEVGHWEQKLVKEAYTEKVLVREAGYY